METLRNFFNSEDFMPHGHCFLWQPDILWLHVLSDAGIAIAYYAIPLALLYFMRHRADLPFKTLFALFAMFIWLCGTTHLMGIWVLWHPDYAISGVLKALTALVSISTFFITLKLIPQALQLVGPEQLAQVNTELQLNIKEKERAQQALKEAYEAVERKVEERTTELKRLLDVLSRSNEELDEFAYITSHDLKEPLRGITLQTALLKEDYGDTLDDDGNHRLERLSLLAQRMERLINDLLYFSRLGHAELAIQETGLDTVIDEVEHMLEPMLHEQNARILIPRPLPVIICNKPRIAELYRNLITNAVKYNDQTEKQVEIGVINNMVASHGPVSRAFYVKDNGVGIPAKFHESIFRIFKRLQHPKDKKDDGSGVGLTFVKKIVERHDGHIWVESEPGKGSTFYFTLNLGAEHIASGNEHD